MLKAAKREPAHTIYVDQFLCEFDQRASDLFEGAEAGHVDQETASLARRVRAAADRFLQVSGPDRDERRLTVDRGSSEESEYFTD